VPGWIGETVRITGREQQYLTAVGRLGYRVRVLPSEVARASLRAKLRATGLTQAALSCAAKWITVAVVVMGAAVGFGHTDAIDRGTEMYYPGATAVQYADGHYVVDGHTVPLDCPTRDACLTQDIGAGIWIWSAGQ
jgi:hypothetical protein